jgi:four helix bundle protein
MRFFADRTLQNLRLFDRGDTEITVLQVILNGLVLASTGAMTPQELKDRTRVFAVEIIKFVRKLPQDTAGAHLARQLVKSGTAVGANYRAACRSKSSADFISKMTTVEEEADETLYWLELLVEADIVLRRTVAAMMAEAEQLLRIVVASIKTARGKSR